MSNGNAKDKGEKETSHKKERKPKKKQDKDKDDDQSEKEKPEKSEKMNNKKSSEKESNNSNANNNNGNNNTSTVEQTLSINSTIKNDEITLCKQITEEIIRHETSWPFLEPVNTKHFPTYRKIIKKPMDFTVIKNKLHNNR